MRLRAKGVVLLVLVAVIGWLFMSRSHDKGDLLMSPNLLELIQDSKGGKTLQESHIIRSLTNEEERTRMVQDFNTPLAIRYINEHRDYNSYHVLYAISLLFPQEYDSIAAEVKSAILCSALENTVFLNDWGVLDTGAPAESPSAVLLLRNGTSALKHLSPLLDDKSRVHLFGSELATLSEIDRYRRCDFVYRYICLIMCREYTFYDEVEDRDRAIEQIRPLLNGKL